MSEEIASTGQFPALNSTDFATSHQASNSALPRSASATPAAQTVNASAVSVATQPAKQPSAADVTRAIAAANANLSSSNRTLDYRVDAVTGISIATIRNSQTGVVVQQIPGADIIALARLLAEWAPGKHMLLDVIA
jgi:flagellar protein FlaG